MCVTAKKKSLEGPKSEWLPIWRRYFVYIHNPHPSWEMQNIGNKVVTRCCAHIAPSAWKHLVYACDHPDCAWHLGLEHYHFVSALQQPMRMRCSVVHVSESLVVAHMLKEGRRSSFGKLSRRELRCKLSHCYILAIAMEALTLISFFWQCRVGFGTIAQLCTTNKQNLMITTYASSSILGAK